MTAAIQTARELISFRIREQDFCIDIVSVREIRGWTPATPLPRAPAHVMGVINLRGAVMPVIDLAARLGLGSTPPNDRNVIVVVWDGARQVGLMVDAVSETLTIDAGDLHPAGEVAAGFATDFVEGFLTLGERTVTVLRLAEVLPSLDEAA
ncbi:MAG TPA: chemotaxis protein CheW [Caulobacteraceae bacterium]|nr:chemotaxis protein CheW [Caulobacteraceae bacterium]